MGLSLPNFMTRLFIAAFLFLLVSCSGDDHKPNAPDKNKHQPVIPDKMTKQLVGSYKMSIERDPSGTPTLFILPGNRYMIAYFGGVQAGNWQSVKDSFVVFMPDTVPTPFALYGRHNPLVKDSVQISFEGFSDEPCFIAFTAAHADPPVMTRVFNKSPNCIHYPIVSLFDETGETVSFASQSYDADTNTLQRNPIFTFSNREKYNDFVAYHFAKKESELPFYALYKNGQLFFNQFSDLSAEPVTGSHLKDILDGKEILYSFSPDGFARKPLPTTGDDALFIHTFAAPRLLADTVYYSPFMKLINLDGATFRKLYTYRADKGAYVSTTYTEGEEDGDPEEAYNSENMVYLYQLLSGATSRTVDFTINEDPIFTFKCDE